MDSGSNKYEKLSLPKQSAWEKKTYDPVLCIYRFKQEWPIWVDGLFDIWFVPKNWLRNLFSFVKKLKLWLPVIWKDKDWDDYYIFEIIKTKLLTQREYLVKNYRHAETPKVNRDITICLNLIDRFQNSYYEVEYFDFHDQEIWFSQTEWPEANSPESEIFKEGLFELKNRTIKDNLVEFIDKYPSDRRKAMHEIKKLGSKSVDDYKNNQESRLSLALHMSHIRHQKCKRLIFLIISQKIEHWWD